jgi:hypothetical protein
MKADIQTIIGKKFGKLTVISFSHIAEFKHKDRLRKSYYFNCACDCGSEKLIKKNCLTAKISPTRSCGCSRIEGWKIGADKQKGIARPKMQKPNGESILNTAYNSYKNSAIKRKLTFNLSIEEFKSLTSKNCSYCHDAPSEKKKKRDFTNRKMNGIDRIDSSIGYEPTNSVPCCKVCNYMKQSLSLEQMHLHMLKIFNHMRWNIP